jgi:hypothetical protein
MLMICVNLGSDHGIIPSVLVPKTARLGRIYRRFIETAAADSSESKHKVQFVMLYCK